MSTGKVGLVASGVLLLAGGAILWYLRPRPVVLTVDVTGTPGLTMKGTSEVDGQSTPLAGTVPMHLGFEGDSVFFSVDSDAGSGHFDVNTVIDSGHSMGGSGHGATAPDGVVRVWAKSSWGWEGTVFGSQCSNEKAHAKAPR